MTKYQNLKIMNSFYNNNKIKKYFRQITYILIFSII